MGSNDNAAEPNIKLGGYAAKQCPVRTHNDFAPLVPEPDWTPSPDQRADLEAGIAFEAVMFDELRLRAPNSVSIDSTLSRSAAISETVAAMEAGAPLILGGWLPDDESGGRKGKPDILLRVGGGYVPADVKNHGTVKAAKTKSVTVSPLDTPMSRVAVSGHTAASHHYDDGVQLAHYTRMLQALGFHPGERWLVGAILGTSALDVSGAGAEPVFAWLDLTAPVRVVFTPAGGKVRRSLLECYDMEHAARLRVAAVAARIVGADDDPEPLVVPVGQKECGMCPYGSWCAAQMGQDDASVAITINRLDTREWAVLREMGLGSVTALAGLDTEDPGFHEDYVGRVGHLGHDNALKRLNAAARQARMIRDGVDMQPAGDVAAIQVPAADIEIDLDLEWDKAGRIYQWGLRVREGWDEATACYAPIISFSELDDDSELRLAEEAAARIAGLRERAAREGKTVAVYHWHHVEVSKTRKFDCAVAALDGITVDLLTWLTHNFHVRGSASIKSIAPMFDFAWAVGDPGGRGSQDKIELVRAGGDGAEAARQWCLRYNESDVAAQAAIRDGIRRRIAEGGF